MRIILQGGCGSKLKPQYLSDAVREAGAAQEKVLPGSHMTFHQKCVPGLWLQQHPTRTVRQLC